MSPLIGDETQALLSQWVADTTTEVDSEILSSIEPEALERIAFEIESFKHAAQAFELRRIARAQRAAIDKAKAVRS